MKPNRKEQAADYVLHHGMDIPGLCAHMGLRRCQVYKYLKALHVDGRLPEYKPRESRSPGRPVGGAAKSLENIYDFLCSLTQPVLLTDQQISQLTDNSTAAVSKHLSALRSANRIFSETKYEKVGNRYITTRRIVVLDKLGFGTSTSYAIEETER